MKILRTLSGIPEGKKREYYDRLVEMSPEEYRAHVDEEERLVNSQIDALREKNTCDWVCGLFRCYKGQVIVPPYVNEPTGKCPKCNGKETIGKDNESNRN